MTSKHQFQQLAQMHAADARTLFAGRRFTNAVHLAGVAIECALKVLICDHFVRGVLPDKNLVIEAYQHRPDPLVGLAGIRSQLNEKLREPDFKAHWTIIKAWSIDVRYDTLSGPEAAEFLDAALSEEGVLEWIKTFW